jgi:hypothetical protein
MPFSGLTQEFSAAFVAVVVRFPILVVAVVMSLVVALWGAPAPERPDIIRALADLFRSINGRRK